VAERGLERGLERDLIEAGLNEPLPWRATAKISKPVVLDDRRARTGTQLGRYGTDVAIPTICRFAAHSRQLALNSWMGMAAGLGYACANGRGRKPNSRAFHIEEIIWPGGMQ
jgi:hypothetical protein